MLTVIYPDISDADIGYLVHSICVASIENTCILKTCVGGMMRTFEFFVCSLILHKMAMQTKYIA